jgi:low temperature requirement protein LtrA
VPMAAATSTALGEGAEVFAVTLGLIMLLGFAIQALSVERGSTLHAAVVRWITPNVIAIVVLLVGAAVGGTGQVVLWILSLAIVLGAMVLAGQGEWLIRTSHMAERHGLIYIVALGEVIVAIGLPVVASLEAGEGVPGRTVAALVASGVFAGLLWWGYFDRVGPALEHRGTEVEGDKARGRYVRDVYTWAHAPIVAGVILAAAALEEITLHPDEPLALSFRMMLAGGLTAMLVGVSVAVWRAFHAVARERIVCAFAVFAFLLVAANPNGLVLLGVVVAAMAVTLAVEHRRIER